MYDFHKYLKHLLKFNMIKFLVLTQNIRIDISEYQRLCVTSTKCNVHIDIQFVNLFFFLFWHHMIFPTGLKSSVVTMYGLNYLQALAEEGVPKSLKHTSRLMKHQSITSSVASFNFLLVRSYLMD